ncbi:hypothetical protein IT409_01700 [Candidatus Falkowbacteria bacterium]|nr:hypothetical protein [Candidatus Falkowbacteria bacterium]
MASSYANRRARLRALNDPKVISQKAVWRWVIGVVLMTVQHLVSKKLESFQFHDIAFGTVASCVLFGMSFMLLFNNASTMLWARDETPQSNKIGFFVRAFLMPALIVFAVLSVCDVGVTQLGEYQYSMFLFALVFTIFATFMKD